MQASKPTTDKQIQEPKKSVVIPKTSNSKFKAASKEKLVKPSTLKKTVTKDYLKIRPKVNTQPTGGANQRN